MKTITLLAATLLLTGCATTWNKPGATQQEFHQDKAMCISRANQAFPPSYSGGAQYCSNAGYSTYCNTTPGQDTNAIGRAFFFRDCMRGQGWVDE